MFAKNNNEPLKLTKFKNDVIKSILVIFICYKADRSFALGIRIGFGIVFLNFLARILMKRPPDSNKSLAHTITSKPVSVMLFGPLREEMRCRFIMLRILKYSSGLALPSIASEPIPHIHLSFTDIVAIIGSAIDFGLMHFNNSETQDNYDQVVSCIISGLLYGILSLYFDPQVTIAAHIANNSLLMCFLFLSTLFIEPMLERLNERLSTLNKDNPEYLFINKQIKALNDIKSAFNNDDCSSCMDKLTDKSMTLFSLENKNISENQFVKPQIHPGYKLE